MCVRVSWVMVGVMQNLGQMGVHLSPTKVAEVLLCDRILEP